MEKLRSDKGFTLIEILVSVTIFAIGLLALASMQLQTIQGNAYSQGMTEGTALAQGLLEDLIGRDYDHAPDLEEGTHQILAGPEDRYTLGWTVTEVVNDLGKRKDISATVSWQEKGMTKSVAINAVKAEK